MIFSLNFFRAKIIDMNSKTVSYEEGSLYYLKSQIVIQAGGKSERWGNEVPKAVTPVGKKQRPLIDLVIANYLLPHRPKIKEMWISVWYKPDLVIDRCEQLSKYTGIEFHYLRESEDRRLGRAGIIIESLENGSLDKKRPIISAQSSDVINYNPVKMCMFTLEGLKNESYATELVSKKEPSQVGHVKYDPNTKKLLSFVEQPVLELPENEAINLGVWNLDPKFYSCLLSVEKRPIDFERGLEDNEPLAIARKYVGVFIDNIEPNKRWIIFKTPKDHSFGNTIDFAEFYGENSLEKFLDPYQ